MADEWPTSGRRRCRAGRAIADHLVTERLPLAEAPGLLADLAARRRHVRQAVFTV